MKPLSYGDRIYIADVQRLGFSFRLGFDQKCRNDGGLNLDELEIYWDIYTALCPRHFGIKPLP